MSESKYPPASPAPSHPATLLHQFLEGAADARGDEEALRYGDDRYTFRELDERANALARALHARGIGAGDRVLLYLPNQPAWLIAAFGILKAGAAAVLASAAYKHAELRHVGALTGPCLTITDTEGAAVCAAAEVASHLLEAEGSAGGFEAFLEEHGGERLDLVLDPEETEAALCMSSGTTGLPKAVRHAHRSLVTGALQWRAALGMGADDRLQTFTPLSHILGLANAAAGFASGALHRLFTRFDLDTMLHSIEEDRITIGIAVAPIAIAMADHPELERFDLSSLRYFDWCATPVVEDVARRFTERTGVGWHTAYGATEAPVLTANPVHEPERWRLDTPGLPAEGVEMQIVDLESHEPLTPGESGEVVVRGPNLMKGYLPEEANEEAFLPGGWYRTGDVGWMEPEGWLHLTDRVKEMIKVSGFQVAPAEIEAELLAHPSVADCAVFGVAHPVKGQVPRAAVALHPSADPVDAEVLIRWSAQALAGYKRLSGVDFVETIPRTPSGKALRRVLQEACQT